MDANIFREYDIRGIVGMQLTDETVAVLGSAIATFFAKSSARRIALGYDARESSPRFCRFLTDAFSAAGIDTVLIGMVPTPVLYHTVYTRDVDGGVMITGSHNPPDHNGFKICLGKAALFGSQIQEIREIAFAGEFATGEGNSEQIEVLDEYRRDLIERLHLGERKIHAVIDSGNGMGGITGVPIYKELGVDLTELYTDPDPDFPNHHPDPTVEENLEDLVRTVHETGADIGIAFDGDGDRLGVVDETGRVIWGDELMVLFSRGVLDENPGATIIAEVKCSKNLFDDIEARGGKAIMWKAGHSLIKAKMKETGAALAGEMSGHMFFADRFYGFDDAAYAGGRLLEILSRTDQPLSSLLADLPKLNSTPEIRTDCGDDIKFEVVRRIAVHFAQSREVNTTDGARIDFEEGWGLVRASNTQAILVSRFEAATPEALEAIRTEVETVVDRLILEETLKATAI